MVVEPALGRLGQRRKTSPGPTFGQTSEDVGVTFTGDQRLDHGPARHPVDVSQH
jgi:hypothetical protein